MLGTNFKTKTMNYKNTIITISKDSYNNEQEFMGNIKIIIKRLHILPIRYLLT